MAGLRTFELNRTPRTALQADRSLMRKQFGSDGLGTTESHSPRTFSPARLSGILLVPCLALSAIALYQSEGQAQSFLQRRIQERMQELRLQEEAKLTERKSSSFSK